ncbi:MAG: YCF48-related protein, partial [Polyangiaceae bacterium]
FSMQQLGGVTTLRHVAFVSPQVGWILGYNSDSIISTIHHTTDGGVSWAPQDVASASNLSKLHFVDAKTGWAVGGNGTILHTIDGGG